ncbi:hypothetical protein RKD35_003314 [Streptomyces albogriseolus]
MTEQQQTPVADPPAEPPEVPAEPAAPPAVRKDRRGLRAALRWSAAVVVFAVAAAGTAYGITRMERTDVPGLATESDGRWDYPPLTKPPLPSGSPGPQAESNPAGTHHADLRALLLPAPKGAKENRALRGAQGWLPADVFLKEIAEKEDRDEFRQRLVDWGLRHIAARGWTTEDGTRTRIYLLRFDTAAVADDRFHGVLFPYSGPAHRVTGTENVVGDETLPGGCHGRRRAAHRVRRGRAARRRARPAGVPRLRRRAGRRAAVPEGDRARGAVPADGRAAEPAAGLSRAGVRHLARRVPYPAA